MGAVLSASAQSTTGLDRDGSIDDRLEATSCCNGGSSLCLVVCFAVQLSDELQLLIAEFSAIGPEDHRHSLPSPINVETTKARNGLH